MDTNEENEKYNLPSPHNSEIMCVQMPASEGEIEEACNECRNDGFYINENRR